MRKYYDSDLSIWLSVDPLMHKYPSLSPYVYCANNPIILVDPDGREVIINGCEAEAAFSSMQKGTNLTLTRDEETGKIDCSGDILNSNDKQLYDAIKSKEVTVNIDACGGDETKYGHYDGTTYNAETNTASSNMRVNIDGLISLEKTGAEGSGIIHEATEGYRMGLLSIDKKGNIREAVSEKQETIFSTSIGNVIRTRYEPLYPKDYSLWEKGHSQATTAPNEMTRKMAEEYKKTK